MVASRMCVLQAYAALMNAVGYWAHAANGGYSTTLPMSKGRAQGCPFAVVRVVAVLAFLGQIRSPDSRRLDDILRHVGSNVTTGVRDEVNPSVCLSTRSN